MKKIFLLLLLVLTLVSSFVFAKDFSDVESNHWAFKYIDELSEKGVINGYEDGTFKPNGTVTRGEFIKLVVSSCISDSLDITKASGKLTSWAKDYVQMKRNYYKI